MQQIAAELERALAEAHGEKQRLEEANAEQAALIPALQKSCKGAESKVEMALVTADYHCSCRFFPKFIGCWIRNHSLSCRVWYVLMVSHVPTCLSCDPCPCIGGAASHCFPHDEAA